MTVDDLSIFLPISIILHAVACGLYTASINTWRSRALKAEESAEYHNDLIIDYMVKCSDLCRRNRELQKQLNRAQPYR